MMVKSRINPVYFFVEIRCGNPEFKNEIHYLQPAESHVIRKIDLSPSYQYFVLTWQDKQSIVFLC